MRPPRRSRRAPARRGARADAARHGRRGRGRRRDGAGRPRATASARTPCRSRSRPPSRPAHRGRSVRPAICAHWAPVRRPTVARSAPDAAAAAITSLSTRTPEGTRNAVAVLGRRQDGGGRSWVHVRLPCSRTAPRDGSAAGRSAAMRPSTRALTSTSVGCGPRSTATGGPSFARRSASGVSARRRPRGEFYVRNKLDALRQRHATGRSPSAPAHARRRRPTGRPAASSGSTAPTGRSSSRVGSRTDASACATPTSSSSPSTCRSAHH